MYAVRSNFLAGRMPSSLGCVKAPAPAPAQGAGVLEEASRWVRGTEEREEKGRFWPRGAVLPALEGVLRLLASAAVRRALAFRRFSSWRDVGLGYWDFGGLARKKGIRAVPSAALALV